MLLLSKIKKSYHQFLALDIDEVKFDKGLSWIKGANGSGKTTLFKIISGLSPFDGEIVLDGNINCKKHPQQYRLYVNYAPAEPVYPTFLTGNDLIDFYITCKKGTKEQAKELIDVFNMRDFIGNAVGTYSSGMLKKFSIACAFIGNPKLIVLDEPLITLDEQSADYMYELIKKTLAQNVAVLISSHQKVNLSALTDCKNYLVENKTIVVI